MASRQGVRTQARSSGDIATRRSRQIVEEPRTGPAKGASLGPGKPGMMPQAAPGKRMGGGGGTGSRPVAKPYVPKAAKPVNNGVRRGPVPKPVKPPVKRGRVSK